MMQVSWCSYFGKQWSKWKIDFRWNFSTVAIDSVLITVTCVTLFLSYALILATTCKFFSDCVAKCAHYQLDAHYFIQE